MEAASNMPAKDLADRQGVVVVDHPFGAMPVWQQRMDRMQKQLDDLQFSHRKLAVRVNKIAVRALVDDVRTKLNGGVQLSQADKATWNTRIQGLTEEQRQGLTVGQVRLTRYGQHTAQGQGANDEHAVSKDEVAEAVLCLDDNYRALFKFIYNEELPFEADSEDDLVL